MPQPLNICVGKLRNELLYGRGDPTSTVLSRNTIIRRVISAIFPDNYQIDTIECCALLRVICRHLPPEKHLILQIEGLVPDSDTGKITARSGESLTASLILDTLHEAGLRDLSVYLPDHPDEAARYSWVVVDA